MIYLCVTENRFIIDDSGGGGGGNGGGGRAVPTDDYGSPRHRITLGRLYRVSFRCTIRPTFRLPPSAVPVHCLLFRDVLRDARQTAI